MAIDHLDGRLIVLLAREPRIGVLEASRRLGVARGTVQARPVPEVLELHTTTGQGDMLCRLVARSNADLQRVIDRVVGFDGIVRASTAIVMENPVPLRVIPLVEQAAQDTD